MVAMAEPRGAQRPSVAAQRGTIGIDVAKATVVAACWQPGPDGQEGQGEVLGTFANAPEGYAALAAQLAEASLAPQGLPVVLEPTGGYELPLLVFGQAQGWQLFLPNPADVRHWARGRRVRAKTDRQDALLLARYGAEEHPKPWQPVASEIAELESLQRRKEDLEQLLRSERTRAQQLTDRPGVSAAVPESLRRVQELLEEELRRIEQAIADLLAQHADVQAAVRELLSVPGVGRANVVPLLVFLARWSALTDGQGSAKGLVAYAGLDPQVKESGTSVRGRTAISRQGSSALRSRLFMGALGGVRGANPLRDFYGRLVAGGKPKKLALVAAARKLLVWAWAVYRTHTRFDPAKRHKHRVAVPS
jgi:transposase